MGTANETLISATSLKAVALGSDLPDHRGIWVGGSGNLDVQLIHGGATVTIPGVIGGTLLPLRVKQIMNTSTATGLLLWV
ncbi:MAG: hypothetical protein K0S92_828 [Desertimonas sp.]|jgi:hypothetical protein|nr:hypothetical protein [Desertimonas sp.]